MLLQYVIALNATSGHDEDVTGKRKSNEHAKHASTDAEQMRIFVAIGQSRTLTEAAASLQLPLFTVSRALKRIESAAKLLLVRRDASGLELTGAGREYFNACFGVLNAHREVTAVVERHRNEPEGTLRISTPVPFARHVLTAILPEFRKLYPRLNVDVSLYCSDWDQPPKAVHDLFLKVRTPKDSRHHQKIFPAIRQGLFASPEYLGMHAMLKLPSDLEQHSCLGQTRDHSAFAWNLLRNSEQEAIRPNFAIVVSDMDVLVELALRSAGIAVLPLWRAHPEVVSGRLARVLPEWTPEEVTFCALHSGRTRMPSKELAFLNYLGEILGTRIDPRCRGEDASMFFVVKSPD